MYRVRSYGFLHCTFSQRLRQTPSLYVDTAASRTSLRDARRHFHASGLFFEPQRTSPSRKRTPSLEDALLRRVNTLVGQRQAEEAVNVVLRALHGDLSSLNMSTDAPFTASVEKEKHQQRQQEPSASSSKPAVFSSKAFAAALYACEATQNIKAGLSLVAAVRQQVLHLHDKWLQSEHVLSVILRLQCLAGDRDAATHMCAYLQQHGLWRLRSASAFLQFACLTCKDRRLAFATYEQVLQHKLELLEPDYVALGRLCVSVGEPITTLFFMLGEMREHVPEVSETFVRGVLEPWISMSNRLADTDPASKSPRYHLHTVSHMHLRNAAASPHHDGSDTAGKAGTPLKQCGVCPACSTELAGYPFTSACRAHLLKELTETVIPRACRTRRAVLGFEHWKRYLTTRLDRHDRVDVFIDGANLGYYGLSSWYDLAKRELMRHRGVQASQITAQDIDFHTQCKASGKGVDVGVNFALIDQAAQLAVHTYGFTSPLVMLHERHIEPRFLTTQSAAIVQTWRSKGWLYCSPTGLNDDLCWLYGALLMTDPTDGAATGAARHRTLVCTNDKMRDHHFRLLSPRAFTRWRDRHRIGFRCARVEDRTVLHWDLPRPYERCIQQHTCREGRSADRKRQRSVAWHIPFSILPAPSVPSENPAAADTANASEASVDDEDARDQSVLTEVGSDDAKVVSVTPDASPWICITSMS